MFILSLCQAVFGVAALVACAFAIRSVIRHQRSLSFYVTLSGACSLAFFLATPQPAPEMILLAVLMIATGALLIPAESQRSTRQLLDDDFQVLGDSTAARRLRK
jgi:predicted signal transduction protein with EAL and GGDEF domain